MRWALNLLHRAKLRDRVYGPELTLRVCRRAAQERLPIYLYGSTPEVLEALAANLVRRFPGLEIAGYQPSKFRQVSALEKRQLVEQIRGSGAKIVLLGLGCPRQEVWAYEYRQALSMPVLAVGAAFDYHSGRLRRPPAALQQPRPGVGVPPGSRAEAALEALPVAEPVFRVDGLVPVDPPPSSSA